MTGRVDVDAYLAWTFDLRRRNCWHMLRAVWLDLTGRDLGDRTPERITTAALVGRFDSDVPAFERLPGPAEPSIVLMERAGAVPHVGAYFGRRVLQMTPGGASYMPLPSARVGFEQVGFFR